MYVFLIYAVCAVCILYCYWRYKRGRLCTNQCDLTGRTAIVTGANTGIGKETVYELAKRNARVILACRDMGRAKRAMAEIRTKTANGFLFVKRLDLSSFDSIREFVKDILKEECKVHILVNNAAVLSRKTLPATREGFEAHMGVNHLGHFLLTNLLLERLKLSGTHEVPSRVVVISSYMMALADITAHDLQKEFRYPCKEGLQLSSYSDSKLANGLFVRELARRLEGTDMRVFCTSPGIAWTDIARFPHWLKAILTPIFGFLLKTPWEGCQSSVYCATEQGLDSENGGYIFDCAPAEWPKSAENMGLANKLWEMSEKLTEV